MNRTETVAERILRQFEEDYVTEQAHTRQYAENNLGGLAKTYSIHICKCILGKNTNYVEGWKREIGNYVVKAYELRVKLADIDFVEKNWVKEWFLRSKLTDAMGFKTELRACKRKKGNDYLANHNDFDCDKIDGYYTDFIISLEEYRDRTLGSDDFNSEGVSILLDPFLENCWNNSQIDN